MDPTDAKKLTELGRRLPAFDVAHNDLMLAGNALARPFASIRANQAALEAARAGLRGPEGAGAIARAAEAKAAEALLASIDGEMARLRIAPAAAQDREISVYGYVRRHGAPVPKAQVQLMGRGEAVTTTRTATDGSFALVATSDDPVALEVSLKGAVVYRDDEPMHEAGRIPAYRLIDLDAKTPPGGRGRSRHPKAQKPAARPAGAKPADTKPQPGVATAATTGRLAKPAAKRRAAAPPKTEKP